MAMTAAQRKAKNAERMRLKRAVERAEAGGGGAQGVHVHRAPDVHVPSTPAPTEMRDEVEASLTAMKWLVDSDRAAKAQARRLAKLVDELEHSGETTKALSAHRALTKVLNDLGGTPMRRMMHELRSLRGSGEVPHDEDHGDESAEAAENVTQFKRPPKRSAG